MQRMRIWNWTKENAGVGAAIATVFLGLIALLQFGVLNPINQRFDAIDQRFDAMNQRFDAQGKRIDDLKAEMNQRFDAQDRRVEDLAKDISELRKLGDRVSRNEGRIDVLSQQLQTADAPSPPD